MAKAKKNGTYLNVCIESQIYERLERMCEAAGQSKTTAVERALTSSDIMQEIENLRRSFPILSWVCQVKCVNFFVNFWWSVKPDHLLIK